MKKQAKYSKTKLKLIWSAPKIQALDDESAAKLKALLEPFKRALEEQRRKQKEEEFPDLPPAV
jgi:hypothetical protein